MRVTRMAFSAGIAGLMLVSGTALAETVIKTHGLSLLGEPKYGPDATHLEFVNPDAPKGGTLRIGARGGFDNLNGFIPKGNAAGVSGFTTMRLMSSPMDEMSAEYGEVAETMEYPEDYSWVIFNLRPEAQFHDGSPMTAADVVFSFNILKEKGDTLYRYYYRNATKAEALTPHRVKFTFDATGNRELPQIMGQLPVLSAAYWKDRDFTKTTLEPPLGSGPYKVTAVKANESITLERVKNWWAKDLLLNRGRYNFDRIQYTYLADENTQFESFKAYNFDYRRESTSKRWATQYDFPAVKSGDVIKARIDHARPTGMQAFAYNLRRPVFQDKVLREALSYAFDFEWSNQNLFFGQYARTTSYFSNSDLASSGLPSAEELKLLEPLRGQIPDAVFTTAYKAPVTDGKKGIRKNLRVAAKMLKAAGYKVENKTLIAPDTGKPVAFEILLYNPAFERIVLPFARNLKRLGVAASVRIVDAAQYQNRLRSYDFDMTIANWGQSESPGNEQREMWSTAAAERPASRNLAGIKSPAIDALIEKIIFAENRQALITATRALDRVLLHSHFVIPQWHAGYSRLAYWNKFDRPAKTPKYGNDIFSWWIDPVKAEALDAKYR